MGSEQSSNRNNQHFVYVREERAVDQRQAEAQRRIDAAVLAEQQRKLYEARLRIVQAEAEKAKNIAEAQAAEARVAEAKAAAQAQALQAQATQLIQAQAAQAFQAAQARAAHAQASQAQAAQVQAAQARVAQAQAVQTRAAPVTQPRLINSTIIERSRKPYSLSGNDLQRNTSSPGSNLYPNLNFPSTSAGFNNGNQLTGSQNRNQTKNQNTNPFNNVSDRESPNDFVFVQNRATPSAPQRDRSVSSSRGRINDDDDISCPTCKNTYGTRIFQCSGGHSSCDTCKQRRAPCGKCGQIITDMRNITLEDYVSERKVSCPNSVDGCQLFIKNKDIDNHLKECPFGALSCPLFPNFKHCTWNGKVSQLSSHFKDAHPDFCQADVDTEMLLINICTDQQSLHLITIGPFNFLLHVKIFQQERKICMAAQMIGTQMSAMKWNYEIHVYNKREPRRKYQYNDTCTSSSIPVNDIFNESKCVELPLPYALSFYNDGCLAYKFFIKKTNDGHERSNFRGRGRGRGRGGAIRKN
ncbi:hypothetical protein K1T71_011283 [Dendrolimus kikuchii]|uniref:Uncharacterized protein n=1 Tax=Dendrolimus kikuchii TaxID=765133 RepID=A0ACC1CNP5_9NEOP|nr:hypothetical protein K1T71_011283 [Dendrolimus kikuchii]